MRIFLLSFFLFFSFLKLNAQVEQRVLRGTLTGEDGAGLPGVSIVVKGTTTGTVTDTKGYYSLLVPLGSTVVFSFIGYSTQEVKVTKENSFSLDAPKANSNLSYTSSINEKRVPLNTKKTKGEATLTDDHPRFFIHTYYNDNNIPLPDIYSIRFKKIHFTKKKSGGNGFYIFDVDHSKFSIPIRLEYNSSLTLEQANRLPKLQDKYAQGRPIDGEETWQGAETGEVFTWGPKLSNLEYDGIPYPFDKRGGLTKIGSGTGYKAQVYNPYDFLRNGSTYINTVKIYTRIRGYLVALGYDGKHQNFILPNANSERNKISLSIHSPEYKSNKTSYSFNYSDHTGNILGRGSNISNIWYSILTTPPSFDNSNNLPSKEARKNVSAYQFPNGKQRSYSSENSDNPYWLINSLPDREQNKILISTLSTEFKILDNFNLKYQLAITNQINNREIGLSAGASGNLDGRIYYRKENINSFATNLSPTFTKVYDGHEITAGVKYDIDYEGRSVHRSDAAGYDYRKVWDYSNADTRSYNADKSRTVNQFSGFFTYNFYNFINLQLSNKTYASNTYSKAQIFLPTLGASLNVTELPFFRNSHPVNELKLRSSYSKSLKEAPLLYSKWHYNSLYHTSNNFNNYYESEELIFNNGILPEEIEKFETGVDLSFLYGRLGFSINYFNNQTNNAILPLYSIDEFNLENVGDLKNHGYDFELTFRKSLRKVKITTSFSFTRFSRVVKRIYGDIERLPLAGFENISTNLIEGQSVGVIFGTRYKRNEEGKLIIGSDGYPLLDEKPGILGDPNPDWIAGVATNLSWKNFSLGFVFDIKKGGQIWNGTKSALNYLGRSKETQDQREIRNYIYNGVKEDGKPNDIPVDFANPANGLEQNKWVRYGFQGVGEDAIEDASSIRLSEIKLTYDFTPLAKRIYHGAESSISVIGRNIFVLSKYSGVDPSSSLFEYEEARGLDLFNLPSVRSYGLLLNLKF